MLVPSEDMLGDTDHRLDTRRPPCESGAPQATEQWVRTARASIAPGQRRAGTEQVVVVQGVHDRDLEPTRPLPDAGGDAGQVAGVHDVRPDFLQDCLEPRSRRRDPILDVIAVPTEPVVAPVDVVQGDRPVRGVVPDREGAEQGDLVTALLEAVEQVVDVSLGAAIGAVGSVGVDEKYSQGLTCLSRRGRAGRRRGPSRPMSTFRPPPSRGRGADLAGHDRLTTARSPLTRQRRR